MVALRSLCVLVALMAAGCGGLNSKALAPCGNGTVERAEACDDGFSDDCGTCNADCTGPGSGSVCGDGERCAETEHCDDGFADACGSCDARCAGPGEGAVCGDGVACAETERCDDGFIDECGSCNADCSGPGSGSLCGDGVQCAETELCDDGFTDACGSCDADCQGPGEGTCGDGVTCPETEACDDGFVDACGSCDAECSGPGEGSVCGDGEWCAETEGCDRDVGCYVCTPVIYVDGAAPAGGDGATWETAFRYLADALGLAADVPQPVEVWIAAGAYRPDLHELGGSPFGDRYATFRVPSGTALFGGLISGQIDRAARDLVLNETILHGDLAGDDVGDDLHRGDNSRTVVRIASSIGVRLDGLTIRGGTDAGILVEYAHAVILERCQVVESDRGLSSVLSTVVVSECLFARNGPDGGISGGGLTVQWSAFLENRGRAISSDAVQVSHSLFVGNVAETATLSMGPSGFASNCVFSGNSGAYVGAVQGGTVCSSTFYGNFATGGVSAGAIGDATVVNSIIYGNSAPEVVNSSVEYSCVPGLQGGVGVIASCQPVFVDADGPDDILGTLDDDLRLLLGSSGLDAGRNSACGPDQLDVDGDGDVDESVPLDLARDPRQADVAVPDSGDGDAPIIDMGAYELQP